jgi:hypothetical protein
MDGSIGSGERMFLSLPLDVYSTIQEGWGERSVLQEGKERKGECRKQSGGGGQCHRIEHDGARGVLICTADSGTVRT